MKKAQTDQILIHLQRGYSITQQQAIELFSCYRLAARIKDLRNKGWNIHTKIPTSGTSRFAKYYLTSPHR